MPDLTITQTHEFRPKSDRYPGSCRDCNRVAEVHPPSPHIERDITDERRIKEYAAGLYPEKRIDVHRYIGHAEHRAHDGPVRDADTRDFDTDGLEEASDWTNYVAWKIQQIDRLHPEQQARRLAYCDALVAIYDAWRKIEIAQHTDD